jgi:glycosyltransferase involved in cell wall biosynthesis
MKPMLSVVVSAYNEEASLSRCLTSVKKIADEIIVVDNTSSDRTVEIAKRFTKKIYTRPNLLMLNTNKNFGFSKATGNWILNLDADEEVTPELANEILTIVGQNDGSSAELPSGYWINRKTIIFGKWIRHGLWWPDRQLRLFVNGKGKFACENIHEYVTVDGITPELTHPMNHYNYSTVAQYLSKIDRCTTSEALVLKETGYVIKWWDAIRFPLSDFTKIYFAEHAYRDGLHGLVLALFQAFYSFVTFTKAWEMHGFPDIPFTDGDVTEELTRGAKEVRYWMRTQMIEQTDDPTKKLWGRIVRKIDR